MKKWLTGTFAATSIFALAACGADDSTSVNEGTEEGGLVELIVGASNVPHAKILEEAQPLLKEQGVDLVIEKYQDYILPNQDLEAGEIDANYFQSLPYFEEQIAELGYDFVNAGGIHVEPIGVYSQKYDSLDELPDGAEIIMSNSVTDHPRILTLLEEEGLITLDPEVDKMVAEVSDVQDNPKNLDFSFNVEASLLVQFYENDEGDAILINSNYAIDAGINPLEDSIALEGSESPYVNIIAVNSGDEDSEAIQKLVEVLTSEEIQDFILEEWHGSVVPVDAE